MADDVPWPITVSIIENHLDDFRRYSQALLLRDAGLPGPGGAAAA